MDLTAVHHVHMAINQAHRFVYFVPEAAEEYTAAGVEGWGPGYFGVRTAPLGAVPAEVVLATFYNFSPAAVFPAVEGLWSKTTPAALQAARFRAASRAMHRAGVALSDEQIAEARAIIDPVVAGLDLAGKPLAAANAAVALPADALTALWQQVTVVREWRGDIHIALLIANGIDPCSCMVLQAGTGRFPRAMAQASRGWSQAEWDAAVARLAARGWAGSDGTLSALGVQERERIEADTDRCCADAWASTDEAAAYRLAELLAPIDQAMAAAGTYAALR